MSEKTEWVLLVECYNITELHTLRASLEACGIPCRIQGEHTHGVLGPIHGAVARSRVLVPHQALDAARRVAEDIVGPFEQPPEDEDDDGEGSPFRTSAELIPFATPHEEELATTTRPKSYGVLFIIGLLGIGPLFGLSHIYVHRNLRAGMLALSSTFAFAALLRGASWAPLILAIVWIADLVGGAFGISAYNRSQLFLHKVNSQ